MSRKNHPTLACFCVCVFLFFVLNEMSPMVSFLVGCVINYFRKASGLASWEAVPSSPFELDLGPGFFTGGFGLKGDMFKKKSIK